MPEKDNLADSDNREQRDKPIAPPQAVSFPWLMFCLAALFDLIGLIPIINFASEILAGFIVGFWQKSYAPQTDPIITFFTAKIIDAISLGILPSNIGIVIYAYAKKKAAGSAISQPDAEKNAAMES